MPLGDSVVVGGDDADARLRGFFAALPVLRLAVAVRGTFLPFVLFLAITPPLGCATPVLVFPVDAPVAIPPSVILPTEDDPAEST
jgi:hypothetical protein